VFVKAPIRNLSFWVVAVAMMAALPASAQDVPKLEGTISYAATHVTDRWYDVGVNIDGSVALNNTWAVLGEVGWGRARAEEFDFERTRAAFNVTTFGGGLRYNRVGESLRPFAQIVIGMSRDTFDPRTCFLFAECVGAAFTTNSLMAQPGAGAVWKVRDNWGVVGQVDYRRVIDGKITAQGDEGFNAFRVAVGIRFMSTE
jgi:hypothetical protein